MLVRVRVRVFFYCSVSRQTWVCPNAHTAAPPPTNQKVENDDSNRAKGGHHCRSLLHTPKFIKKSCPSPERVRSHPRTQVEFQRQLRAGRTIAQARRRPEEDDEACGGGAACCFRLGLSRRTSAALALAYSLVDAAWCAAFAVAVLAAAWAIAVEADGTVRVSHTVPPLVCRG